MDATEPQPEVCKLKDAETWANAMLKAGVGVGFIIGWSMHVLL